MAAAAGAVPVPVPVVGAEAAGPGEEAAGAGPPGPARLARLPLARVKALVKADPDVSLASQEAVFVLARATVRGGGSGRLAREARRAGRRPGAAVRPRNPAAAPGPAGGERWAAPGAPGGPAKQQPPAPRSVSVEPLNQLFLRGFFGFWFCFVLFWRV